MDTLKLAEDIERSGFTSAQARGLAHAIHDSAIGPEGLATKQDIADLRTEMADLRADMAELRTELKTDIADIKTNIAELKAEIKSDIAAIWWKIAVLLAAQIAALVAIIELRLRLP